MMRGRTVLIVGLLALASGCATRQREDVARYRAIADPPGPAPRHEAGAPLTLVEALRLTAFQNERLAVSGEQYLQALADRQRLAAARRPTLDFFADTDLRENTGNGIAQTDLGLTAQYRLLTGLGDLRNVNAADARARSREWLILDLRESLLLEAARAYYETLRAERLTAVLESSVRAQQERLDDARARNEVGFTRPLDVSQIEAQVSRTRTQLITSAGQAREARAALTLLTGTDVEHAVLSDGFDPPADGRGIEAWLALAAGRRQDVVAARHGADAARSLVDAAISQYAPSITINLDYFLVRTPDDSAASLASLIQVRVPLFSAGRIEADVRGAWSVFRQRVLEYRLRVREVRRDVETAAAQVASSRARARELVTRVQAAGQTLALAEASYQAGLGTNLERTTAQDQLLAAELEAASEEFTTKTATLALRRACGLLSHDLVGAPLPQPRPEELIPPEAPLLDRTPEEAR